LARNRLTHANAPNTDRQSYPPIPMAIAISAASTSRTVSII
jgi:hypothetical protein